jgi:hypothetical protein
MSKAIIIGLDGATFDLIKLWVDDGRLPRLDKLMKKWRLGQPQVRHSQHIGTGLGFLYDEKESRQARHFRFYELCRPR